MNHNQREKLKKEFLKKFNLGRIKMSYLQGGDVFDGENYTRLLWNWIDQALIQARAEGFTDGMNEGYLERSKDLPKSYQKGRKEERERILKHYVCPNCGKKSV